MRRIWDSLRFSRDDLKNRLSEIDTTLQKTDPANDDRVPRKRMTELVYGDGAVAEVQLNADKIISFDEAKNLILWVMADGNYLPWACVQRKPLVRQCVLIHVAGIDVELWNQHKDGVLKTWSRIFDEPVTTIASHPTTTAVQSVASLLRVVVKTKTNEKNGARSTHRPKKRQKNRTKQPCTYDDLKASSKQLKEFGFPLMSEAHNYRRFVRTPSVASEEVVLVAMDCEMCETVRGSELTRLSVVDENGDILVDTFVKPDLPITDYRTEFSGITRELLADVTINLEQAQEMFFRHVGRNTIMVGHSLENDLKALEIFHDRVIDTSMIYPHPAGFPRRSSLKFLAKHFLGKTIQDGAHDSVTDARIALQLVKLKMDEGLDFGIPHSKPTQLVKLTDVLHQQGRVCCMIDRAETISKHSSDSSHVLPCASDNDVKRKLISQLKSDHHFIWAQFQDLYRHYIARNAQEVQWRDSDELKAILNALDKALSEIYDLAPSNTLITITTGHGDTSLAINVLADKSRREAGLDRLPTWTEKDEEIWATLANRVVQGLLFARVKGS